MKKVMIASATVFALFVSAGMSSAHPLGGHGAFGGGELPRPNLGAHIESDGAFDGGTPISGLDGAAQSAVKEDPELAINREFEPGLVSDGGRCSEIPPNDHHNKYSPCF